MNTYQVYFDRQTTNIIKGIALIMMFIHHFFTFPDWWIEGVNYARIAVLAPYFCMPLKLCVPVFSFITGYFYYYNKHKTLRYSLGKIRDILISYWCVLLPFALLALVLVRYPYTLDEFLLECLALKRPSMFFCWYVNYYIAFMLIFPWLCRLLSHNICLDLGISFVLWPFLLQWIDSFVKNPILWQLISDLACWFPVVLAGYLFAGYGIFQKIEKIHRTVIEQKAINIILMTILVLLIPMGRYVKESLLFAWEGSPSFSINMDILYTPIFIYAIVYLCRAFDMKSLKYLLVQLGKYSLLMWFVSCIFYGNCKSIFQPVLYFPHRPVLVTIWGLILCFIPSYFLQKVIGKIQNLLRGDLRYHRN